MPSDVVLSTFPLGFPWKTFDPFLFCVHHLDRYPAGNERMGPAASLAGRNLGMDFEGIDGWRMYHGDVVPGFPRHPHRGFETVTVMRSGFVDHSDSLGAAARFGQGDVQWMTAGRGIVHSEMFPLLDREQPNPAELFQIWLNLPSADKLVEPHFTMLWSEGLPRLRTVDPEGRAIEITVIAGALDGQAPPPPPPNSWAARPDSDVAIWSITMAPGASYTLPPASPGVNRTVYPFEGGALRVAGTELHPGVGARVRPEVPLPVANGASPSQLLVLQGRPIGEPVVQYGPFVMTTPAEIQQAYRDYQRTEFGAWPWGSDGPVHAREEGRFAIHADGRVEKRS